MVHPFDEAGIYNTHYGKDFLGNSGGAGRWSLHQVFKKKQRLNMSVMLGEG